MGQRNTEPRHAQNAYYHFVPCLFVCRAFHLLSFIHSLLMFEDVCDSEMIVVVLELFGLVDSKTINQAKSKRTKHTIRDFCLPVVPVSVHRVGAEFLKFICLPPIFCSHVEVNSKSHPKCEPKPRNHH